MKRITTGRIFVVASALSLLSPTSWGFRPPEGASTPADIILDANPVPPPPAKASDHSATISSAQTISLAASAAQGVPQAQDQLGTQLISYLMANPQLLEVTQTPTLRVDYIQTVPGFSGLRTRVYVHLLQTVQGIDVADSDVSFSFDPKVSPLRLDSFYSRLYPEAQGASAALVDSTVGRQALLQRAHGGDARPQGSKIRMLEGRWQAVREFALTRNGLHGAVNKAGHTYVWDDRRYSNTYTGRVQGRGVAFDPVSTGNALDTLDLGDLEITDRFNSTVFTDAEGQFSMTTDSPNTIPVWLSGRWDGVGDRNGATLSQSIPAGSLSPVNLLFNPSGNLETDTSQVTSYYQARRVHDYIKTHGVNLPGIDVSIPLYVNINDVCNAYYSGGSLNFYKSGGGCINTAFDTVIYHEYGHFIDDIAGGIPNTFQGGALSEGWGDVVAMYLSGQPMVGEGFYGIPGGGVRNGVNSYRYQGYGEVHAEGQAWMGFAWDLRTHLIASLGQSQGVALAENLVLPVFLANPPDIPSAVRAVALRDDDDNNIANGTPHIADILAAANNHGLGFVFDDVTLPNANSATFIKLDTTTQGNWPTAYGADGQAINSDVTAYPSYAPAVSFGTAATYIWPPNPTSDVRALQKGSGSDRIASTWYSYTNFTIDTNLTDGGTHQVALYALDWDGQGTRKEQIEVLDADSNTLLNSQTVSNFSQGQYLVWTIKGHVLFRVTTIAGGTSNAVVSGIFFGGAPINQNTTAVPVTGDFDGDGKSDQGWWNPSDGMWHITHSSNGQVVDKQWGTLGDIPVPGDYDGDGKTDVAVWRPSEGKWYVLRSSNGQSWVPQWGIAGDIPTPGDYDGDGKTDVAVWRPSDGTSYVLCSSDGHYLINQWGLSGDIPVPGDYDGDGKTDVAVWRPSDGTSYVLRSSDGHYLINQWGQAGDIPVPGDYDGDGKTDVAIWQPSDGKWYVLRSSNGQSWVPQWGQAGDIPKPADFNGDKKADTAVWRPGNQTWYVQVSNLATASTNDQPAIIAQSPSISVLVHPNPFRASRGDSAITFDQMTSGSTVKIFTVSGRHVITLDAPTGSIAWNLKNDSGDNVASGLYLYLVTDPQGNKTKGKFAVIR